MPLFIFKHKRSISFVFYSSSLNSIKTQHLPFINMSLYITFSYARTFSQLTNTIFIIFQYAK